MKRENSEAYNPYLKSAIMEAVENQLKESNPPQTQQTFDRLKKAGYTERQAKEKIGAVFVSHLYDVMKLQKPFDNEKYVTDLQNLK